MQSSTNFNANLRKNVPRIRYSVLFISQDQTSTTRHASKCNWNHTSRKGDSLINFQILELDHVKLMYNVHEHLLLQVPLFAWCSTQRRLAGVHGYEKTRYARMNLVFQGDSVSLLAKIYSQLVRSTSRVVQRLVLF